MRQHELPLLGRLLHGKQPNFLLMSNKLTLTVREVGDVVGLELAGRFLLGRDTLRTLTTGGAMPQETPWQKPSWDGCVASNEGRHAQAEEHFKAALEAAEKFGADCGTLSGILRDLAETYRCQGKNAEAETHYQRSLDIEEKWLGPDNLELALTLSELAGFYRKQGKPAQAEPILKRLLAIYEKDQGPDGSLVAASLEHLAQFFAEQGNYSEAESHYLRALQIWEQSLGARYPATVRALQGYAALLRKMNRPAEAERVEARAKKLPVRTP
jgi:tetratricopeptide (TPR) repeat protein